MEEKNQAPQTGLTGFGFDIDSGSYAYYSIISWALIAGAILFAGIGLYTVYNNTMLALLGAMLTTSSFTLREERHSFASGLFVPC